MHDHTHVEGHGSSSLLELEQKQLIIHKTMSRVSFSGPIPAFVLDFRNMISIPHIQRIFVGEEKVPNS